MTCLQLPRGKGKMLSFRPKNLAANFIPKKFGYQPKNIFSSPENSMDLSHFLSKSYCDGYPFQYQYYGAPSGTGNSHAWALYENISMKRKKRSRLITREVTTQLHINRNGTYHKLIVGVDKHLKYLLLIPNCPCPVTAVYTVSDRVNSTKSMSQLLLTRSGQVGSIHMSAKEMCFVYISPITNRIIVMYFTRYNIVRSRQMCGCFLFNKTRGHYPDEKMEET